MRNGLRMRTTLSLVLCTWLAGCSLLSSRPQATPPAAAPEAGAPSPAAPAAGSAEGELPSAEQLGQGAAIARAATALIGTPYHFGGADAGGFDCSGLALYVHEREGLAIPRTAAEQQQAARPVPLAEILPGDLLFFRIRKRGIDHVGIYTGAGQFVHAPHAGVPVSVADLSGGFYARHIAGAGRFWEQPLPAR
jgi:cell wall-associated NlpC family hydrolase